MRLQQWIDQNAKGYWSAAGVDAAISILGKRGKNVLQWGTPPPPPKPVVVKPEVPAEVLGVCSDGNPQLPLNCKEFELRRATLVQVRDWQKRRLEANPKEGIISRKFHAAG